MQHLISAKDLNREQVTALMLSSQCLSNYQFSLRVAGKILATLFYEPSTRTRLSFESAMIRSGGHVISVENGNESSSKTKGETLEDTIRTVAEYADIIVLRHPEVGSAKRAADVSKVPVINAGDGAGEHPTQALLDLYTIWKKHKLEGCKVLLAGDLENGRTVHSLYHLLKLFNADVTMCPSYGLTCDDSDAKFVMPDEVHRILPEMQVVYMTRIQKERLKPKEGWIKSNNLGIQCFKTPEESGTFKITSDTIKLLREDCLIMHPLPRNDEIDVAVDHDPRCVFFDQVANGLRMRRVLLGELLYARQEINQEDRPIPLA